tara:strand:- start:114 stop:269 length:156 start_codon:yes stop_codon:yes gene_type:complete
MSCSDQQIVLSACNLNYASAKIHGCTFSIEDRAWWTEISVFTAEVNRNRLS